MSSSSGGCREGATFCNGAGTGATAGATICGTFAVMFAGMVVFDFNDPCTLLFDMLFDAVL
jgi:hypothetical protein